MNCKQRCLMTGPWLVCRQPGPARRRQRLVPRKGHSLGSFPGRMNMASRNYKPILAFDGLRTHPAPAREPAKEPPADSDERGKWKSWSPGRSPLRKLGSGQKQEAGSTAAGSKGPQLGRVPRWRTTVVPRPRWAGLRLSLAQALGAASETIAFGIEVMLGGSELTTGRKVPGPRAVMHAISWPQPAARQKLFGEMQARRGSCNAPGGARSRLIGALSSGDRTAVPVIFELLDVGGSGTDPTPRYAPTTPPCLPEKESSTSPRAPRRRIRPAIAREAQSARGAAGPAARQCTQSSQPALSSLLSSQSQPTPSTKRTST